MKNNNNKKNIIIIIGLTLLITCAAVGAYLYITKNDGNDKSLSLTDMKSQAQFAVIESYNHGVEKINTSKTFIPMIWETETQLWFEYTATSKIGIDASKITLSIKDDTITIGMPDAQVLDKPVIDSKSLSKKSSFLSNCKGFLVSSLDSSDTKEIIKRAQNRCLKETKANTLLMAHAKQRAQTLIKRYITNIGKQSDKKYIVEFINLEE